MHEEALLRDLRRKLDEIGRGEGVERITRVRLRVGALCHVSPETVRARWPALVASSCARDATLEIESSQDSDEPRAQDVVLTEVTVADSVPRAPEAVDRSARNAGPARS